MNRQKLKYLVLNERKHSILYGSNYTTFWKRQIYGDSKKWLPGVCVGRKKG